MNNEIKALLEPHYETLKRMGEGHITIQMLMTDGVLMYTVHHDAFGFSSPQSTIEEAMDDMIDDWSKREAALQNFLDVCGQNAHCVSATNLRQ